MSQQFFAPKEFIDGLEKVLTDEKIENSTKQDLLGLIDLLDGFLEKDLFFGEQKLRILALNLKLNLKLASLRVISNVGEDDISFYSTVQFKKELLTTYQTLYMCYSFFEDDEIFNNKIRENTKKLKHLLINKDFPFEFPIVNTEPFRPLLENNNIKKDLSFFIGLTKV